ncbi:MAG: hypothetical protein HC929_19565 [Leptolyngbyaceae cyanobacterium SM2_5_2]|nr:hypothetical protein [Leptolyngbyaceae cyanobacterium SM2_5_2]
MSRPKKLELDGKTPDLGFKVYKLDKSNFHFWQDYNGEEPQELDQQLEVFQTPLQSEWDPKAVITEIMLLEGFPLDSSLTKAAQFKVIVAELLERHGSAWLETDMRAHVNPARMAVIEQAAHNLVKKFHQRCPQCRWPGFDVVRRLPGLPCASCGLPTALTHQWVYRCTQCHYERQVLYPEGIKVADPGHCELCNP